MPEPHDEGLMRAGLPATGYLITTVWVMGYR